MGLVQRPGGCDATQSRNIYLYIYLYTFCISRSAKFHNSPGVGGTLGQLSWQMANEGWCNLFAHSDVQCHSKAALVTRALHG